jgi:hypothetical protein
MTEIREPVESPAAWRSRDLTHKRDWIHRLSAEEIRDLDRAVEHARASGRPLAELTRSDFPLTTLAAAVERWLAVLESGRGFLLVRGVPVERYGEQRATLAYFGLGLHLGTPVSQNAAGDRLGHVRDTGDAPSDPAVRLYKTRVQLGFHTDGADIIGLLCLRPAKSGGTSRIASSVAIYNEILRRRPDLVPALYEPFPFDRNGEERPGEPPFFSIPVCRQADGVLGTFYIGWYIRGSQRHPSAPRLSPQQQRVVDLIDEIAEDPSFHLDMEFESGDMQWLKNSVTLHARTEYEDFPEPERKRHLLRLWLTSRRAFAGSDAFLNTGIPRKEGVTSDAAAG